MPDATPSRDLPDPLWDRRWVLAGQAAAILMALGVFVVVVAPPWHWPLFWWGASIGFAAAVLIVSIGSRATGGDAVSPERRLRARRQLSIYAATWVLIGVLAGFGSALADSLWPDFLLLGSLLLTAVLLAGLVVRFKRRRA